MKNNQTNLLIAASQNLKEKEYWFNTLTGLENVSNLPYDFKEIKAKTLEFNRVETEFSVEISSKLINLCKNSHYLMHVVQVAWVVAFINKCTDSKDIVVGMPIYEQDSSKEFINTYLPIRIKDVETFSPKDLIIYLKEIIQKGVENQNYPLEILWDEIKEAENLDILFPFDIAVMLSNIQNINHLNIAKPNLVFNFEIKNNILNLELLYNKNLYDHASLQQFMLYMEYFIKEMLDNFEKSINQISLVSIKERDLILNKFKREGSISIFEYTVHQLFERKAAEYPDSIAYTEKNNCHISYEVLNSKANQLARYLRNNEVEERNIVAIISKRSIETIIAIYGVLKTGSCYLVIDPETPLNIINSILDDANIKFVISNQKILSKKSYVVLQNIKNQKREIFTTSNRNPIANLDDLPRVDRSLIDVEKYNRYLSLGMVKDCIALESSRGCPFNCSFCFQQWPKNHIMRSSQNLFEEVHFYYKMGVRRFVFFDDIFNLNVKNSSEFFKLVLKNKLKIHIFFPSGLRGDILDKDYIDLMVEAGTINFPLALETASVRLQKVINKNLKLDKFKNNLDYISTKYPQVILDLFMMHGFPTETEEEALQTIDFLKSIKWVHFPYLNLVRIYPNTGLGKFALENGIKLQDIEASIQSSFHDIPETLPFSIDFTNKVKVIFLEEYFLLKERLLHVLPYQLKVLTKEELIKKYNSYLPIKLKSFDELLSVLKLKSEDLNLKECISDDEFFAPNLNAKIRDHFRKPEPNPNATRVLLIDLSLPFNSEMTSRYDFVDVPLGLMSLLTSLNHQFGSTVNGKIINPRIDFDDYEKLVELINEFNPEIIGVRGISIYRDFFHRSVAVIRNSGINVPIIAGGPYVKDQKDLILQDDNINLAVLGEGEVTFCEIIGNFIELGGKIPDDDMLRNISGIAFIPKSEKEKANNVRQIFMVDVLEDIISKESTNNLNLNYKSSDIAYSIYTSGSTGKPKGVLIEHKSLINFISHMHEKYHISSTDTVLHKSSLSFDVSVWELFGIAVKSGRVHILEDDDEINPELISQEIEKQNVTMVSFVPTMLNAFIDYIHVMNNIERIKHLRYLFVGGEELTIDLVRKFMDVIKSKVELINSYGPTETTVDVLFNDNPFESTQKVYLGNPIKNMNCFVLNNDLSLQPIGVPGELCISGQVIARGYLNNPELTAEKFIKNPYFSNQILYKTGDLVKVDAKSNISFLGRIDTQVKIRGNRIEVKEIEVSLLDHPEIKDVVVVPRNDSGKDKYLVAYYVAETDIDTKVLREFLLKRKPEYMIPGFFTRIDKIPLTKSGKYNRKALENSGKFEVNNPVSYVVPTTDYEKMIATIWKEVLKTEKVGLYNNFFEMGGNSIDLIVLNSKLCNMLAKKIDITVFFEHPTIYSLGKYLEGRNDIQIDKQKDDDVVERIEHGKKRLAEKKLRKSIKHLNNNN